MAGVYKHSCMQRDNKNMAHILFHRDMLFYRDLDDNRRTLGHSGKQRYCVQLERITNDKPPFFTSLNPFFSPFCACFHTRTSRPPTADTQPPLTVTHPPNQHSAFGSESWLATRFTAIHHPRVFFAAVCGAIACCYRVGHNHQPPTGRLSRGRRRVWQQQQRQRPAGQWSPPCSALTHCSWARRARPHSRVPLSKKPTALVRTRTLLLRSAGSVRPQVTSTHPSRPGPSPGPSLCVCREIAQAHGRGLSDIPYPSPHSPDLSHLLLPSFPTLLFRPPTYHLLSGCLRPFLSAFLPAFHFRVTSSCMY